jgi:hypothetical protein
MFIVSPISSSPPARRCCPTPWRRGHRGNDAGSSASARPRLSHSFLPAVRSGPLARHRSLSRTLPVARQSASRASSTLRCAPDRRTRHCRRHPTGCAAVFFGLRAAGRPAAARPSAARPRDRRRQILHQHALPAAHVAAIDLQKERRRAAPRLQAHAVVEDAPVPAIGGVPDRIGGLWLRELAVMRGQVAVTVDGGAEDDARIEISTGSWIGGSRRSVSATNRVMTCCGSLPATGA